MNDEEHFVPPPPPLVDSPHISRKTGRPTTAPVSLIVVHAMAEFVIVDGEPVSALDWLTKDFPDIEEVWSADAIIDPGGVISLLNPDIESHYSWHAGRSAWEDLPRYRNSLNHVSLGVEVLVEGMYDLPRLYSRIKLREAYRPVQYRSLGWLCGAHWFERFNIPMLMCRGHDEVSGPNVRHDPKQDPGAGFDWTTFRERWQEYNDAYCNGR